MNIGKSPAIGVLFAFILLSVGCSDTPSATNKDSREPVQSDPRIEKIDQFRSEVDIDGLLNFLTEEVLESYSSPASPIIEWTPLRQHGRQTIVELIIENPPLIAGVLEELSPHRMPSPHYTNPMTYEENVLFNFASDVMIFVGEQSVNGLKDKNDVDGLITVLGKLAAHEVPGDWDRIARDTLRGYALSDPSIHKTVDTRLVDLRNDAATPYGRSFAYKALTEINREVYFQREALLLRQALSLAGFDPDADIIEPPDDKKGFQAPHAMSLGAQVDIVIEMNRPPANPKEARLNPELWDKEVSFSGMLTGRSKAEIDSFFDDITHVGLYFFERRDSVGRSVGELSDGSYCNGDVLQDTFYVYRVSISDGKIEGARVKGYVNPPGAPILMGVNCDIPPNWPLDDPFTIREP